MAGGRRRRETGVEKGERKWGLVFGSRERDMQCSRSPQTSHRPPGPGSRLGGCDGGWGELGHAQGRHSASTMPCNMSASRRAGKVCDSCHVSSNGEWRQGEGPNVRLGIWHTTSNRDFLPCGPVDDKPSYEAVTHHESKS